VLHEIRVLLKRRVSNLSYSVQVKEVIKRMKNLTIKTTCACGEEVTEKDTNLQADIQSVLSMLEGGIDRKPIANYIREYMLDKEKVIQ
jgi:hypothetical protein